MLAPPLPHDEKERLQDLRELKILDTPIQAGFERITRLAQNLFRVPIVTISFVDEQRQWFKSAQGLDVKETPRDVSFCGHTILQDDFFIVQDAHLDPRFSDNPMVTQEPHIRFYAGYPIYSPKGNKYGAICIGDRCPRLITREEIMPLKDLAGLVETEIIKYTNIQARDKLLSELDHAKLESLVDPLTRLWNRDGMMNVLKQKFASTQHSHHPFGLALVDIDNFKNINDSYGHNIGDRVLRSFAKSMVNSCRETDAISRWGGDEFLFLLNDSSREEVQLIAERIRSKVEQERFQTHNQTTFNITVTLGITTVSSWENLSLEAYINQADQALYEGKKLGRNTVSAYSSDKK